MRISSLLPYTTLFRSDDSGDEQDGERHAEVPLQVPPRRAPPGDDGSDTRHEQQRHRQRPVDLVEERRPDRDPLPGERLREDREERAPPDRERDPQEQQVVEQERALAADERLQ